MRPAPWLLAAALAAAAGLSGCGEPAPPGDSLPDLGDGSAPANPSADMAVPGRTAILASACSGCHSAAGDGGIADLDGYSHEALETALTTYRTDADGTTVMHRLMRGYTEADIAAISQYLDEGGAQ